MGNWGEKKTLIRGYNLYSSGFLGKKNIAVATIFVQPEIPSRPNFAGQDAEWLIYRDHPRDHSLYLNVIIYVYRLYTLLGTNISDFPF